MQQIFNGIEKGTEFINYFYTNWTTNPDVFNTIIKPYSKLRFNSNSYEGNDFILLLKQISSNNLVFSDCKYEILDTQSRQIYIVVHGKINDHFFSQTFLLIFSGFDKPWTLMNSLLIIN